MRVLIVTNHFWPENFRVNDLAVGLRELGAAITVFTGIPDYPEGTFHPGYGLFKKRSEEWNGIRIHRFPLIPRGKGRKWNLVFHYFSSTLMSCIYILLRRQEKYDVIFVFETSPVTIGLPALVLKRLRGTPIVFWVLDLWPESIAAAGAVSSRWLLGLVRRLVRFIYSGCDRILSSSRGFESHIRQVGGYDGEIVYFPNWVEPEHVSRPDGRRNLGSLAELPEGFCVLFAGNIGAAQDFPTILDAAALLLEESDIHWVVLGDGRKRPWVCEQVERRGLGEQFHLLGRFPPETMPDFYSRADALLMTLRRDPIFSLTVPGKLQSYMASGKPIIAAIDGEGAELVERSGAGLTCPAESPDQLAECVLGLYRMAPSARLDLGRRGRAYCEANFNREVQFRRLMTLMKTIASGVSVSDARS